MKNESIIHVRVPNEIKLEVQYISSYYGITESAMVRMLIKKEYMKIKNIVKTFEEKNNYYLYDENCKFDKE